MTRLSIAEALGRVADGGEAYAKLLTAAGGDVGMYQPDKVDPQQPHTRDEVYVIAAGSGTFICDGERDGFSTGDMLLVPARIEHRFVDFTDDLAAWVTFFGPAPPQT